MSTKMNTKMPVKKNKSKREEEKFNKAMSDIRKIGIVSCCLIGILLVIGFFITPKKSYAADFLVTLPESFVSKVSPVSAPNSSLTLIEDTATDNHITLPAEFSGQTAGGDFISYIYCMDRRLGMGGGLVYTKGQSVKEQISFVTSFEDYSSINRTTSYPGLIYILQNHNRLGGSAAENYYYTQIAVWWYIDLANGLSDTENYDKITGNVDTTVVETQYIDKYAPNDEGEYDDYRFLNNLSVLDKKMLENNSYGKAIKQLAYEAKEAEGNYPAPTGDHDIFIDSANINYNMINDYVETSVIRPTSSSSIFESYSVQINNNTSNIEVLDENNNPLDANSINANQGFKLRIPKEVVEKGNLKISINVVGYFKDLYDAYLYNPTSPGEGDPSTPSSILAQRALLGVIEKISAPTHIDLEVPTIDVPNTAFSANVVYGVGAVIIVVGIILIVVAIKPKDEKKNK